MECCLFRVSQILRSQGFYGILHPASGSLTQGERTTDPGDIRHLVAESERNLMFTYGRVAKRYGGMVDLETSQYFHAKQLTCNNNQSKCTDDALLISISVTGSLMV